MVMEAEKSHDLTSANRRTRKISVVIQSKSVKIGEGRGVWGVCGMMV